MVRIASFIIGLFGAACALLLGGNWLRALEAVAKERGGDLASVGTELIGLQRATYALLACGVSGLIVSVVVLIRKGRRVANGAILVVCGALPLVFQTKANGGVLMVLAGIVAFFAKPKALVT